MEQNVEIEAELEAFYEDLPLLLDGSVHVEVYERRYQVCVLLGVPGNMPPQSLVIMALVLFFC